MKKLMAAGLMMGIAVAANAQVLYQTNFDSFAVGTQVNTLPEWNVLGDDVMTIQSDPSSSGRSVRFDWATTPGTGSYWNYVSLGYDSTLTTNKILVGRVRFYMSADSTASTQGPFLGLDAYDTAISNVARIRANASNRTVQLAPGASYTVTTEANAWNFNTWNSLELVMNFNTRTVSGFLNGVSLGAPVAMTHTSTDVADISMFGTRTVGMQSSGMFLDDYTVEAVPEPATLGALGLIAALSARRRKSA
jgi:hypothetical protein